MAIVSTDMLKEGMEVETPIKNLQGQLLFGIGHVLLEKHINMMQAWGIPEADVKIEEDEDDEEAQRRQELFDKTEAEFKPLFKRSDAEHPVVQELLRFLTEQKVNKILLTQTEDEE